MVALGNFQVKSAIQQRSEITYDTFSDTNSLKTFNRTKTSTNQTVTRIYHAFNLKYFNWSESYIRDRFAAAETNAKYADYLVFLLQEEVYTLTETHRLWNIEPSTANGNAYTIEGVTIPKMPNAGESAFLLALLKAWHALCNRLNKKSAILGCPTGYEPNPQQVFETIYTSQCLNYISQNYDMIYIYRYPITGKGNTQNYRAKEFIDYWRKTLNYTGKINYILDTLFGVNNGSSNYITIKDDFKNAADNGADIISTYPSVNMITQNDFDATPRMIQIYNELYPNQCNPVSCNFTIN